MSPFHKELGCRCSNFEYDFMTRVGTLYNQSICDMSGVVEFFKRIDPAVVKIETHLFGTPDTVYVLINDKWEAKL